MAIMIGLKQFHTDNTREHNTQAIAGMGTRTMFTKATVKQGSVSQDSPREWGS